MVFSSRSLAVHFRKDVCRLTQVQAGYMIQTVPGGSKGQIHLDVILMTGEVGEAGHDVYRDSYTDPSSSRGSPPADQGR